MIKARPFTSAPLIWGAVLLLAISLSSCARLASWGNDTYEISYDSSTFFEKVNTADELNLVIKNLKDSPQINAIAIHPATIDFDLGTDKYFEQAIYSFESKLDKLTNSITKTFELEGVKERRTSITGYNNGNDALHIGFLRIIISQDTILMIDVVGESKIVNENIEQIQKVIDSAKVKSQKND